MRFRLLASRCGSTSRRLRAATAHRPVHWRAPRSWSRRPQPWSRPSHLLRSTRQAAAPGDRSRAAARMAVDAWTRPGRRTMSEGGRQRSEPGAQPHPGLARTRRCRPGRVGPLPGPSKAVPVSPSRIYPQRVLPPRRGQGTPGTAHPGGGSPAAGAYPCEHRPESARIARARVRLRGRPWTSASVAPPREANARASMSCRSGPQVQRPMRWSDRPRPNYRADGSRRPVPGSHLAGGAHRPHARRLSHRVRAWRAARDARSCDHL